MKARRDFKQNLSEVVLKLVEDLKAAWGKACEPLFPKPDSWPCEGDIVNLLAAGFFSS